MIMLFRRKPTSQTLLILIGITSLVYFGSRYMVSNPSLVVATERTRAEVILVSGGTQNARAQ